MKALSVKQPFAQLIAQGDKSIEVRSWVAKYRGPLLIVSSRAPIVTAPLEAGGTQVLPVGVSVCVVDLIDVRPLTALDVDAACLSGYHPGLWAWILANPRPCRPVPVLGRLKIFEIPEPVESFLV